MLRVDGWRRQLSEVLAPAEKNEAPFEDSEYAPLFDEREFDDLTTVLDISERRAAVVERHLYDVLQPAIEEGENVKTALLDTLHFLMTELPDTNFAVLWHVVLKEAYKQAYTTTKEGDGLLSIDPIEQARQSWTAHSGRTFERFVANSVTNALPDGMRVVRLDNHKHLRSEIEEGLGVGDGLDKKYDLGLVAKHDGAWYAFGALHAKTTLRERINDDDTASGKMMKHGLYSGVVCVSASNNKSIDNPVPSEFNQTYSGKSNQRKTVEEEGRFDAAFCFNSNTRPTVASEDTEGVVRTVKPHNAPNTLTSDLWRAWKNHLSNSEDSLIRVSPP